MSIEKIILLLLVPGLCFGQKFMVENKDTLPYAIRMEVRGNDTLYLGSCNTLVKSEGRIINRQVECIRKGYWEYQQSDGLWAHGHYNENGKRIDTWRIYDSLGHKVKELEYAAVVDDVYVLKEVHYKNGKATVIVNKTAFAKFYLRNTVLIMVLILAAIFIRVFINSSIYNNRYNTDLSPVYGPFFSSNYSHSIACTFTFWWRIKFLNPEMKRAGIISNLLSVIGVGGFLVVIIGLAISGGLSN